MTTPATLPPHCRWGPSFLLSTSTDNTASFTDSRMPLKSLHSPPSTLNPLLQSPASHLTCGLEVEGKSQEGVVGRRSYFTRQTMASKRPEGRGNPSASADSQVTVIKLGHFKTAADHIPRSPLTDVQMFTVTRRHLEPRIIGTIMDRVRDICLRSSYWNCVSRYFKSSCKKIIR